jgi:serine/threonine protein kinase
MSPELFNPEQFGFHNSHPTKSSDCYALGMVIYETISGRVPFYNSGDSAIMFKVLKGDRPSREGVFPDCVWEMVRWCWAPQPKDRPAIKDVLRCLQTVLVPSTTPRHAIDEGTETDDQESEEEDEGFEEGYA